ncbi:uncharacterized protein LOC112453688 [Temnothorax curvispinosus]|uniref:Uncharacterized protein LOC112453688 n=1 Tax=Temnothorax curvispinosus TaxID=300111 RepID=A0A6J1PL23_9HYME|nr:uncharacterized protein LOC112453688 [Temnothorax curvispinosus]
MVDELPEFLRICHVNCQSLTAHLDEFRDYFGDSGFHVICLSETWLRPAFSDSFVSLRGYQIFRCDRQGRCGGGVAFYISNSLQANILRHSEGDGKPEYLIAKISVSNTSKILLAVVYRPPHCGYLQEFLDTFIDLSVTYKHLIIFGDFNADLCTTTFDSAQIMSFIETTNLYLVPYTPTHHTRSSSTSLDLCVIDDADKLISYEQSDVCFLSAHDLISISYRVKVARRGSCSIKVRDFRSFDIDNFLIDLEGYDWGALYQVDDVDSKVMLLNTALTECYDRHAPLRDIQPKHLPASWLTPDVRCAMRSRDRARRVRRRHKTDANYKRYKTLRNQAQAMVRSAKKEYYLNAFRDGSESTTIWRQLRHLGLLKAKNADKNLIFTLDELNEFFSSVTAGIDG